MDLRNSFKEVRFQTLLLNVSANTERSSVNATFSYNDETGFVPNNTLERINFGIGSNTQLSDRFNLSSSSVNCKY